MSHISNTQQQQQQQQAAAAELHRRLQGVGAGWTVGVLLMVAAVRCRRDPRRLTGAGSCVIGMTTLAACLVQVRTLGMTQAALLQLPLLLPGGAQQQQQLLLLLVVVVGQLLPCQHAGCQQQQQQQPAALQLGGSCCPRSRRLSGCCLFVQRGNAQSVIP
jgi:hypothetical protein